MTVLILIKFITKSIKFIYKRPLLAVVYMFKVTA